MVKKRQSKNPSRKMSLEARYNASQRQHTRLQQRALERGNAHSFFYHGRVAQAQYECFGILTREQKQKLWEASKKSIPYFVNWQNRGGK